MNGGYIMKGIEFKRIMACVIAVCMIATLLPETFLFVRADDSGGEMVVIGFEAPEGSWAEQSVPLGRGQDELVREGLLYMPSSLTVLVLVPGAPQVEPGPGFDGPEIFDESAGDTGAPTQSEDVPDTVVKAAQVPVTWPTVIDGETAGVFILEPIISGGYVLGEGVNVPTVTVTVEDVSIDMGSEAGRLLRELLDNRFPGVEPDGIAAVLAMDEDTLLDMIADYEQVLAAVEEEAGDGAFAAIMDALRAGIDGTLAAIPMEWPVWVHELPMMDAITAGEVELQYIDGSGTAFIYHGF